VYSVPAPDDEAKGNVEFRVVVNDGKPESISLLTELKEVIRNQLPNMALKHITRVVFGRAHRSIVILKKPHQVIG